MRRSDALAWASRVSRAVHASAAAGAPCSHTIHSFPLPCPSPLCTPPPLDPQNRQQVDSILIDEARTPLIISGQAEKPSAKYLKASRLADAMARDVHYTVDEKQRNVLLTEAGCGRSSRASLAGAARVSGAGAGVAPGRAALEPVCPAQVRGR